MNAPLSSSYLVADTDPGLHATLLSLANLRMVFFAGLPATGKSLLVHQLAHLAQASGRTVHLLQWDVVRPVFEATPAGQRFPKSNGQASMAIRPIIGRWARGAVLEWRRRYSTAGHVLLGEVPLVGGRLIELTEPADDAAEPLLTSSDCRFVLPAPTNRVRRHIEAERARRSANPLHPNEREDASPRVLQAVWPEVLGMAAALGIEAAADAGTGSYDEHIYSAVYRRLLQHRPSEVITIDRILPTSAMSVYDVAGACRPLLPSAEEAEHILLAG